MIPLPVRTYEVAGVASVSALVNCFKEKLPAGARQPYFLRGTPGITSVANATDDATAEGGGIKAMHAAFGRVFFVSGTEFLMLERSSIGVMTVTKIGDIGPCTIASVDIDSNADKVVVVNNPDAYYCDSDGANFTQISDSDFTSRGAAGVEFLGNYLVFREPNSGRFFCSNVGSASAYDSLDFATAEVQPDDLVGHKADHEQLLLFGQNTMEIWSLVGGAGFPFAKASNGFVQLGCANGRTIAANDETVFWVASDFTVRALRGTTPQKVSHYGIEEALSTLSLENANAWAYTQGGHLFYVLNLESRTFVFDITENEWHERKSYERDNSLVTVGCYQFGMNLVGDGYNSAGRIGKLDTTAYDEFGDPLVMQWTYQTVYANGNRALHDRLEVMHRPGVGLSSGQGSDPVLMMEVSDDGGQSFDFLPNRKLGKLGQLENRAVWHRLGSSYQRVYRASISDPVERVILDTQLTARGARF